jgi:hypothetical protein
VRPVAEFEPEHEMLVPAIDGERFDACGFQAIEDLSCKSVSQVVERHIECAAGDQPPPTTPDHIVGAMARPHRMDCCAEPFEPISTAQPDDVSNQRGDRWRKPSIDPEAADERDQSIEIPAHRHNSNGA